MTWNEMRWHVTEEKKTIWLHVMQRKLKKNNAGGMIWGKLKSGGARWGNNGKSYLMRWGDGVGELNRRDVGSRHLCSTTTKLNAYLNSTQKTATCYHHRACAEWKCAITSARKCVWENSAKILEGYDKEGPREEPDFFYIQETPREYSQGPGA